MATFTRPLARSDGAAKNGGEAEAWLCREEMIEVWRATLVGMKGCLKDGPGLGRLL